MECSKYIAVLRQQFRQAGVFLQSKLRYLTAQVGKQLIFGIGGLVVAGMLMNGLVLQGRSNASPGHDHGDGIATGASQYPLVTVVNPQVATESTQSIESAGQVLSKKQGDVFARRDGVVQALYVDLGSYVQQGQTIAVLQPDQDQAELQAELGLLQREREIVLQRASARTDRHLETAQKNRATVDREVMADIQELEAAIEGVKQKAAAEMKKIDAELKSAQITRTQSAEQMRNVMFDLYDLATEALYERPDAIPNRGRAGGTAHFRRHEVFYSNELAATEVERQLIETYRMLNNETEFPAIDELILQLDSLSKQLRLVLASVSTNSTTFPRSELDHLREKANDVTDHFYEVSTEYAKSEAVFIASEAEKERLQAELDADIAQLLPQKNAVEATADRERIDIELEIVDIQANYRDAELDVAVIDAKIAKVKQQIGASSTVYAPFSGVITKRHVNIGDSVNDDKPLFSLVDDRQKFVRFFVSENDLPFIRKGGSVQFSPTAAPSVSYSATIARIAQAIDPVNRTIQVEADIAKEDDDGRILTEMTVRTSVPVILGEDLLAVPKNAFDVSESQSFVWVVNSLAEIERKSVEIAYLYGDYGYVSRGLSTTDWIVINAPVYLEDGLAVDTTVGSFDSAL